jgi:hypothetical protein
LNVKAGKLLVLFGNAGFGEASAHQGNAQKHFKVDKGKR